MGNETVTLSVDMVTLDKMRTFYADRLVNVPGEYVDFAAKEGPVTIIAYHREQKETFKVTFSGRGALEEAHIWDPEAKVNPAVTSVHKQWLYLGDQIGSDEVGTGDFFGPVTVVAAYVTKADIKKLQQLGIDDSKRMSDAYILEIGPKLIKHFKYSSLTVDNPKFNALMAEGYNMNSIKAMLHNRALLNLQHQYGAMPTFIDQFCPPNTYMRYLALEKKTAAHVTFRTKGESYYPSVALASVIARYSFLKKMEALGKPYGVHLPHGASKAVDAFAKKLLAQVGPEIFDTLVKKSFKNYARLFREE